MMADTVLDIEKVKRSATIFGFLALQKLSNYHGTGSLADLEYRVVINTYCSFIILSKMTWKIYCDKIWIGI